MIRILHIRPLLGVDRADLNASNTQKGAECKVKKLNLYSVPFRLILCTGNETDNKSCHQEGSEKRKQTWH